MEKLEYLHFKQWVDGIRSSTKSISLQLKFEF